MSVLSLGVVDYDPLVLYALRGLVQRSSERIRLLWSVRSRRAALRHLAADEPTPDVILVDAVSDRSKESAPLEKEASQALRPFGHCSARSKCGNCLRAGRRAAPDRG